MELDKDVALALSSPFDDSDVKWKPQVTTKGRDKKPIERNGQRVAGCTAHIDARAVMNRLDEVVGVGNWSDSYTVLLNGANVECTLTVCGVSKSDVGEHNKDGFADAMKAAYSDALKRAAVKFGIGRYLYDMEMEWLPFDGYKILQQPTGKRQPKKQAQSGAVKKPLSNSVADVRASLDEIRRITIGIVCDHASMTDLYTDSHHALNALKQYDFAASDVTVEFKQVVTKPGALKLFDWLIDRKETEAA